MFTEEINKLPNDYLDLKYSVENNLKNTNLNGIFNINTTVLFIKDGLIINSNFSNIIGLSEYIKGLSTSMLGDSKIIINNLDMSILLEYNTVEIVSKIYSIIDDLSNIESNVQITVNNKYTGELLKKKINKTVKITTNY